MGRRSNAETKKLKNLANARKALAEKRAEAAARGEVYRNPNGPGREALKRMRKNIEAGRGETKLAAISVLPFGGAVSLEITRGDAYLRVPLTSEEASALALKLEQCVAANDSMPLSLSLTGTATAKPLPKAQTNGVATA